MEMIDQISTIYTMVMTWYRSRDISATLQLLFFASAVVLYVRGAVKSEKLITHTRDRKANEENQKLKLKINNMLSVIESRLYNSVQKYVYSVGVGNTQRISIIRKSKAVDIRAGDYLVEYHESLHKSLYKTAVSFLFNELAVHDVADSVFDEEQEKRSAVSFMAIVIFEIHGHAGTNEKIESVENSAMSYELFIELYSEICEAARNLRKTKEIEIEREILEHRIPLFPKLRFEKKKRV